MVGGGSLLDSISSLKINGGGRYLNSVDELQVTSDYSQAPVRKFVTSSFDKEKDTNCVYLFDKSHLFDGASDEYTSAKSRSSIMKEISLFHIKITDSVIMLSDEGDFMSLEEENSSLYSEITPCHWSFFALRTY